MKTWQPIAPLAPLLVALLASPVPRAEASPLTYDFSVVVTAGPAAPQTLSGWFSFDDALVQAGQYVFASSNMLSGFSMDFMGTHYDATIAYLQALMFDAGGALNGFLIGNDCPIGAGFCWLDGSKSSWALTAGAFSYATPLQQIWYGTEPPNYALRGLPEPASWVLAMGALFAAFAIRRSAR